MTLVKYPDGRIVNYIKKESNKNKNFNKSNLGQSFENDINIANKYYLDNNIAVIYKKPTPIQVVKVDYPSRNKAKITEAYYKTPSTTDYNGLYLNKYIDFEAKSCKELTFSFERIYPHQIEHLNKINSLGGIAFLLIEFSSINEVYLFKSSDLYKLYLDSINGLRKSIKYETIKELGYLINSNNFIRLNYLEQVNKIIDSNK